MNCRFVLLGFSSFADFVYNLDKQKPKLDGLEKPITHLLRAVILPGVGLEVLGSFPLLLASMKEEDKKKKDSIYCIFLQHSLPKN